MKPFVHAVFERLFRPVSGPHGALSGPGGDNETMYIDSYGLIAQQDGDMGDSLQREGMYAFGKWFRYDRVGNTLFLAEPLGRRDHKAIMDRFEVRPGIYVRHPDPYRWWSDPDTTSRDQLLPVIAYCGAYQDYGRLWRLFLATLKRGFFAQNTLRVGDGKKSWKVPDSMHATIGLFIRAGGWYTAPLYPLLFVFDTAELVATLLTLVPVHWEEDNLRLRGREPRDVDDNNGIISHLMAVAFKPTPISWLNRQVYALTRTANYGNFVKGEKNPVMGALAWYHRIEGRGNPELAELYRPLVEEYLSPREQIEQAKFSIAMFVARQRPPTALTGIDRRR